MWPRWLCHCPGAAPESAWPGATQPAVQQADHPLHAAALVLLTNCYPESSIWLYLARTPVALDSHARQDVGAAADVALHHVAPLDELHLRGQQGTRECDAKEHTWQCRTAAGHARARGPSPAGGRARRVQRCAAPQRWGRAPTRARVAAHPAAAGPARAPWQGRCRQRGCVARPRRAQQGGRWRPSRAQRRRACAQRRAGVLPS